MVESLLVPKNMTTDQMWESIQVRKETITDWELIEYPSQTEEHLLIWTKLHHNQENESPSLHLRFGISHQSIPVPVHELEYQEWLAVVLHTNKQMGKLEVALE